MEQAEKITGTTMSVRELGEQLGIKRTAAYRLVDKGKFDTIQVNGVTRVVIASFEQWYAEQTWYHKVDGTPPGEALTSSYSLQEFCNVLAISESTAYRLIEKEHLAVTKGDDHSAVRIPRDSFVRWYAGQSSYRIEDDRERDRAAEAGSYTLPEIAHMLGLHRNRVYEILAREPEAFVCFELAGRRRVTKESFERWYAGQSRYTKLTERSAEEISREKARPQMEEKKKEAPRLEVDPDKPSYTVPETAVLLDIDVKEVYAMIRLGELEAVRYGRSYRIHRDTIKWWLQQHKMHMNEE